MTTQPLTQADLITLENYTCNHSIFGESEDTESMEVNRWSKKGDRLYINGGIPKSEKYNLYIDLETNTIEAIKFFDGDVTIEGDKATITIEGRHEHVIILTLEGDTFGSEPEPELVADGGEEKEPQKIYPDDGTPKLTELQAGDRIDKEHVAGYDPAGRDLESALEKGGVRNRDSIDSYGWEKNTTKSLIAILEAPQASSGVSKDVNEGILYDARTDHYARAIRYTDPMSWDEAAWKILEIGNEIEFVPRVDPDVLATEDEHIETEDDLEMAFEMITEHWSASADETYLTDSTGMDTLSTYEAVFSSGVLSLSIDTYDEAEFDALEAAAEKWNITFDVKLSQSPVEQYELRALELVQSGVFDGMPKTAEVWALKESGFNQSETAGILGVNQSTISRHVGRAEDAIERAKWTAENVGL